MLKCYPHRVRCSSENFLYLLCAESFLTGMQVYRGNCKLLGCFQKLSSTYGEEPRRKFLLWKNKDITVDQKTLFWKTWFLVWSLLCARLLVGGKYFQIIAAIPSLLQQTVLQTPISRECLFSTPDLLYLSEESSLSLSKIICTHNKLMNALSEPTWITKWKENFPHSFLDLRSNFAKIY